MEAKKNMESFLLKTLEFQEESDGAKILGDLIDRYNKGELKYLIAYDMGCGNTSAGRVPLLENSNYLPVWWPLIKDGEKSRAKNSLTILAKDERYFRFGQDATGVHGFAENFKTLPKNAALKEKIHAGQEKLSREKAWEEYFHLTFEYCLDEIKKTGYAPIPDISKTNTMLIVAHPAGTKWKGRVLENYRNIIIRGTGLKPEQVITFSEAKASMMYALNKNKVEPSKKVLLIDLGASTVDLMLLDGTGEPVFEFSIELAGRDVDNIIGHALLKEIFPAEMAALKVPNQLPDEAFFQKHYFGELERDQQQFQLDMRLMKEEICEKGACMFVWNCGKSKKKLDEDWLRGVLEGNVLNINCGTSLLTALNPMADSNTIHGTWYDILKKVVTYCAKGAGREEYGLDENSQVIVTGGTANLVGVEDYIKVGVKAAIAERKQVEIFDVQCPELLVMNHPDDYAQTVPEGSILYMSKIITKIDLLWNKPEQLQQHIKEQISQKAVQCLGEAIEKVAIDKVDSVLAVWASPKGDKFPTVNDLVAEIAKIKIAETDYSKVQDSMNGVSAQILNANVEKECKDFLQKVAGTQKFNCNLSWDNVKFGNIGIEKINEIIQTVMKTVNFGNALPLLTWIVRYIQQVGNNTPRNIGDRIAIKNNWKKKSDLLNEIKNCVQGEVQKQFDETEGFGIPSEVMNQVCDCLSAALFESH